MAGFQQLVVKQGGRFIDPTSVGSSIQWRVTYSAREEDRTRKWEHDRSAADTDDCELAISDCSRVINWSIEPDANSLAKLDAAIAELTACRKALAHAIKTREQTRKKLGIGECG